MARGFVVVDIASDAEKDSLRLRRVELPADTDLEKLIAVDDGEETLYCTAEVVELLFWIGRAHTEEDP